MILKRECFITEPSYCYEVMVIILILSAALIISIIIRMPLIITVGIAALEMIIYSIQQLRVNRYNNKE